MRLARNYFDTEQEANAARIEFPCCGVCRGALKIQYIRGEWWVLCMKNSAHRSLSGATLQGER